ncbi:MAG: hypothetical protein RLO51_00325 [Thalassobaculum sp.]|uniref:hypothetical protein n=1 Tax=Thalassobaculum sp. TaxID=2022740 RepID=UPI0032EA971F
MSASILAGHPEKEIEALRIGDDGAVRDQLLLQISQKKDRKTRTVHLNARRLRALANYVAAIRLEDATRPLLANQESEHFSANTIRQLFINNYLACRLREASTHNGRRTYITCLTSKGV